MANYDQEETLARLHDFWERYKFHLITGLLMVLSAVAGLSYRTAHNDALQREAGNALYQAIRAADEGDVEAAVLAYEQINKGNDFAGVRHVAAFALASVRVQNGDTKQARRDLQAVVNAESDDGLRALAALRLAELLINAGKTDEAVMLLTENEPLGNRMRLLFAERRGDAHFAASHFLQARSAYEEALELAADNGHQDYLPVLNTKIGALLSHRSLLPLAGDNANDAETTDDSLNNANGGAANETLSAPAEENAQ